MREYKSFEELELWKVARDFSISIYGFCKTLPSEEKYRLEDQLIRSSRSINANIAEGHGRFHYRDNIRFCRMARGSLMETLNHLITAQDHNYINEDQMNEFRNQYNHVLKLANGYIAYLKRKADSTNY